MKTIPDNVRDILARSTITASTVMLPEQLDRADYIATDKVLKLAGGRWNRARRVHVFEKADPRPLLGIAVEQGTIADKRTDLQQFFTPPELADRVAEEACPMPRETVLEPSAGGGALFDALLREGVDAADITTVDIDPDAAVAVMSEDNHITADFLELDAVKFDVIVMNPPFTKGQAVAHLSHALTLVNRRLVAIMPAGFLASDRKATLALREQLTAGFVFTIVDLPAGSFKDAGTMVRTQLLIAEVAQ